MSDSGPSGPVPGGGASFGPGQQGPSANRLASTPYAYGAGPEPAPVHHQRRSGGPGCVRSILGVIVLAVVVFGFGSFIYNRITNTKTVTELKPGMCVTGVKDGAKSVRQVDCDKPHEREVIIKVDTDTATVDTCKVALIRYLAGRTLPPNEDVELVDITKVGSVNTVVTRYCFLRTTDGTPMAGSVRGDK